MGKYIQNDIAYQRGRRLINGIDYAGKGSTNALKLQNLGEIRFLRALAYYDATSLWGNVPLILKSSAHFTVADQNPVLAKQAMWKRPW